MHNLVRHSKCAYTLMALLLLPLASRSVAAAQTCAGCAALPAVTNVPVNGVTANTGRDIFDIETTPASTGSAYAYVTVSQSGIIPLPASLSAGTYPAWCATTPADSV